MSSLSPLEDHPQGMSHTRRYWVLSPLPLGKLHPLEMPGHFLLSIPPPPSYAVQGEGLGGTGMPSGQPEDH